MSHSVIIIDRFGNPYEYSPPHDQDPGGGGNREAVGKKPASETPFVVVDFSGEGARWKKTLPQSEIPPVLLETLKEYFG